MAELGAVASIVQFVDVAVRLSSGLNRICSDVRNVPKRFQQLRKDLDEQLEVAREIQNHHLHALVSTTTSPVFDTLLIEYIALADELCDTLDKLLNTGAGGLFLRNWRSLRSIRKKEVIFNLCDRLERKKSTLSQWLNAANLNLSTNIKSTTNQTQRDAKEIKALTEVTESYSKKSFKNTEQILHQSQPMNQIIASSSERIDNLIREAQQIKDQSAIIVLQTDTNVSKLDHIDQISTEMFSSMEAMRQHFQQVCLKLSQDGTSEPSSRSQSKNNAVDLQQLPHEVEDIVESRTEASLDLETAPTLITDRPVHTIIPKMKQLGSPQRHNDLRDSYKELAKTFRGELEIEARDHDYTDCKCRRVNNSYQWQLFPILRFVHTVLTRHYSYCPKYAQSERTDGLMVQLLPPSWLYSGSLDLELKVEYWRSKQKISISPMIVGTSRLVDRNRSPAFLAVSDMRDQLKQDGFDCSPTYVPKLKAALDNFFNSGKASPFDTDRNGNTLLYEVLWIYIRHLSCGVKSDPGLEYVPLIQSLLDQGSDPNVISFPTKPGCWDRLSDTGGTAFDLFAKVLRVPSGSSNTSAVSDPISLTIFQSLAAAEGGFSKPFNSPKEIHPVYRCNCFDTEAKEYMLFEEQVDLCDLGALVPIILRQHEKKFQKFLMKSKTPDIDHASSVNGLSPMHFAVVWPTALKALIERGANVNVGDQWGRRPIHLAVALGLPTAVDYLLRADCALFTPASARSLLESALTLVGSEKRQILDALVIALADRHTRLIDIARSYLPTCTFSGFELIGSRKKERQAPRLRETLLARGFTTPAALELDDKSVYNVASFHGIMQMTNDVADTLWNSGFEDINEPNEDGLTPFLQNWFCANFPMVDWFLEKGISLFSEHRDASLNALHLYALRMAYPGAFFSHDPGAVPTDEHHMAKIQEGMGILHDECTCLCSPNGCSPLKFLIGRYVDSRKTVFREWLRKVKPEPELLQQHVLEFTRCLLFDFLGCKHTCCVLGQEGEVVTEHYRKCGIPTYTKHSAARRFFAFQHDGLPRPLKYPTSTQELEMSERALHFCMSKYDEMPRREDMLPEEQPFDYIKWIVAHFDEKLGVDFGAASCGYCHH